DDAEPLIVNNPAGSGTLPEIWELEPAHAAAKSAFAGATDAPSVAGLAAEMRYGSLHAEALAIKPISGITRTSSPSNVGRNDGFLLDRGCTCNVAIPHRTSRT